MRKIFLVLSVLSAASASTAAFAQAQGSHSGTDAEQKACARDVQRFCRPVMDQGDLVILSCLKENRPKLTKACGDVLISHGQ
jgi:Cysteine rich repeat